MSKYLVVEEGIIIQELYKDDIKGFICGRYKHSMDSIYFRKYKATYEGGFSYDVEEVLIKMDVRGRVVTVHINVWIVPNELRSRVTDLEKKVEKLRSEEK
jgi:hypothetical protein